MGSLSSTRRNSETVGEEAISSVVSNTPGQKPVWCCRAKKIAVGKHSVYIVNLWLLATALLSSGSGVEFDHPVVINFVSLFRLPQTPPIHPSLFTVIHSIIFIYFCLFVIVSYYPDFYISLLISLSAPPHPSVDAGGFLVDSCCHVGP